jgi:predicted P-loop ATPase
MRNNKHNTTKPDTVASATKPDHTGNGAVEFLERLRPGGPWVLTAIIPDGVTTTITARNADAVRRFVRKYNGEQNLYYSVNPTRTAMTKKAAKKDIAAIEFLLADLDPEDNEKTEDAKTRYLAALNQHKPASTAIIDSGNGIQVLWRLEKPIVLEGDTADKVIDVEARVKALIEKLGGKAGTQNIDRILRLPDTTNLPNAKKRKQGRVVCETKLLNFNDATCSLDDFPKADTNNSDDKKSSDKKNKSSKASDDPSIDWVKVEQHVGWLKSPDDLPKNFSMKGKMIVIHGGSLNDLVFDLTHANQLIKPYSSWSEVSFALAAIFKNDGNFSNEKIAAALMCPLECNQHITRMKDVNTQRRAVERLILRSYEQNKQQKAKHATGQPDWREQRSNGSPLPSMHNARLAIMALSIGCSNDTFHHKTLLACEDHKAKHIVESVLGEVSDDSIMALRQILSDNFNFDFTEKHVRDAVWSLALEHSFDPVADMLDEAEANWDGKKRLDRMAPDYLNCEDTKLNCAIMRKMMIAAVARVRQPGCKFDNITVLESEEGYKKSSAWQVLAGKENFSDEKIIGKDSREVQEQLAEVWIHENADLAGMKKADVDTVKTFASRTEDRARPAFGHFLKKQKRHSIETGTTNNDEYLQSQTGNRRFWSMKVLKMIDLDKLQKDRMQLWGEAAHYESEGESLVLDEKLWPTAAYEQEKRRVKDPWEDVLAEIPDEIDFEFYKDGYFRSKEIKIVHHFESFKDWTEERVASSDLLTYVLKVPIAQQETRHTMKLANVMKHLGWQRYSSGHVTIDDRQVKGYFRMVKNA